MASELIPFESAQLPAHIKQANVESLNEDLTAHAGAGFPVISIKGKTFSIVRDGERTMMMNPKDNESPATYIDVVLIKANKNVSKVFYAKGFKEGESDGVKPDCWSSDGVKADSSIEKPVAPSCAACPNNVWGSRISESGQKAKACQDTVRLAVAAPTLINDPLLLRVPPASIRGLGEYGSLLKKRGVGYNMVLTRVSFDSDMATPKLLLKPIGFLPQETWEQAVAMAQEPIVQNILGNIGAGVAAVAITNEPTETKPAAPKPAAPKPEVKVEVKPPKPEPAKAPAAEAVTVEVGELNLNDLNFDD